MKLNNAEIMLLQLISLNPNKTGYEINSIVKKLGYQGWAGVGKTSVYNGLNRLIKKELVFAQINKEKTGRGPLPTFYHITDTGMEALRQTMLETIRASRERDQRFDIVVSAIQLLPSSLITESFILRLNGLEEEKLRLTQEYKAQRGCTPDGGKYLFERMFLSIENEIRFSELILKNYQQ